MKNRSVAQIVLVNFCKTIGIILLLIGIGTLSYYLTMLFLEKTARVERSTKYEHVIDINTGSESSNLIYSYDEKSKKIDAMVLELFDCHTKNMTYITIPANTQITLSGQSYEELLKKSGKLPQLVTMSKINDYFSGDVAYEYGIKILQEELKADIGYFTAMTSTEFKKCFEAEDGKKKKYRPAKSLLDAASANKEADQMDDFIESKWDSLISDITLSQKQRYSKDLVQVKRDTIRTYRVYGSESSGVFKLDKSKNQKFIEKIWERKEYTEPQKKSKTGSSTTSEAEGLSVFIFNGSRITGLAAKYKLKLEADGYTVKGVGNATGDIRETTTIFAKKKNVGEKFEKYFKSPGIEQTTSMSTGADVEIVLGTNDDLE